MMMLHVLTNVEINYGGRITDKWDKRIMSTLLSEFYNKRVLAAGKYKISNSDVYYIPQDSSLDEYLNYIKELPFRDSPT